jgi:predicted dehydrogenase
MAIDHLTDEQRALGRDNYARTVDGLTRRGFLKGLAAAAAVGPLAAAAYFGYKSIQGNPVKAALIGGGDEGGVLVGEHNPDYLQFIAVADIRPSNLRRIFEGEPAPSPRKGFKAHYGWDCDQPGIAPYSIRKFTDYRQMLRDTPDIEAVVIALPLHLHAPVAVDVMKIGQDRGKPIHVLCEKLMAWDIRSCKRMIEVAKETGSILSIGHQRHYSLLYAHAKEIIDAGVLGETRHIRALWHRNNTWPFVANPKVKTVPGTDPFYRDGWYPPILQEDYDALNDQLKTKVKEWGYDNMDRLVRWRIFNETGGGLMAELGSHQLDASSIFLGKVKPLAVSGVGGKYFYRPGKNERDCEDHVFVTYEFPGPNHPQGPNKGSDADDVVVVTYSSINTNAFEDYGECVMGTHGSMVVEKEQAVMLYKELEPGKPGGPPRTTAVGVSATGAGKPALESSSTAAPTAGPTVAAGAGTLVGAGSAPVSRGYREEMEDFAYCIRQWDKGLGYAKDSEGHYRQRLPRCHGEVAMADAIIALTANQAMKTQQRVLFKPDWFLADKKDAVPDDPNVEPKVHVG